MRRGRGLASNPDKIREWQDRSRDRARERERSTPQGPNRLTTDEAEVRRQVFARDGRCVLRDHGDVAGRCWGQWSFHHRRKASDQGAYVVANGLTLCIGHNRWVEDEPDLARDLDVTPSLVVRQGDPEWESLGKRANR